MSKTEILSRQILRLAKMYNSRPISVQNFTWHNRVLKLQCNAMQERKQLNKKGVTMRK